MHLESMVLLFLYLSQVSNIVCKLSLLLCNSLVAGFDCDKILLLHGARSMDIVITYKRDQMDCAHVC